MRDVKLLKERARSTQYKQHSPQRPVGTVGYGSWNFRIWFCPGGGDLWVD